METTKAAEAATYERGVVETETRLTAEVTVVCRDYCAETYRNALDRVGVPANSDLRKANKVYYPEDIRDSSSSRSPSPSSSRATSHHPRPFLGD